MALLTTPPGEIGSLAAEFQLPGVDGKLWSLESFRSHKGLAVLFICNHCPYVIAVLDRIVELGKVAAELNIGFIAISSNDPHYRPEDGFEQMKVLSQEKGFTFPYCFDETQDIARTYGAVCTPDPFIYQRDEAGDFRLFYRGRLDDSWKDPSLVQERDFYRALNEISLGIKQYSQEQYPSMGCSLKWKS